MLHGAQSGMFDLSFELPAVCAQRVVGGQADIGIVPVATLLDHKLEIFRGAGIASYGPVRSILLISKKPFSKVGVLAVDSASRTSVILSRIFLSALHGCQPALISMRPQLKPMLEAADAALIIGDPALLLDPGELRQRGLYVADLGAEWTALTDLPMVFAVWAGSRRVHTPEHEAAFIESLNFGLQHIEDIVESEYVGRRVSSALAREYLTRNIRFALGEREYCGLQRFLAAAADLPAAAYLQPAAVASEEITL